MNLTPQQSTFIEELRSGSSSITLTAVAGSGKTTTLVEATKVAPASGIACAFNTKIRDELQKRLPAPWVVKTMNGIGHQAWARHLSSKKISLNTDKIFALIKRTFTFSESRMFPELAKAVNLARAFGIVPAAAPAGSQRDSEENWLEIFEQYDVDYGELDPAFAINMARKILTLSINEGWAGSIDFSDQLYLPVIYGSPFPQYPLVLVDEAQDLSALQHRMLARLAGQSGRIIAVGDPCQAIYGFRGAHTDSMKELSQRFSAKELPLTVSFRCPQSVVGIAKEYVPYIEAAPTAPAGTCGMSSIDDIQRGDAVVCFFNKPLVSIAFALIRRGIGAKIIGRDIAGNLKRLVERHQQGTLSTTISALCAWRDAQIEILLARKKEARAEAIRDKINVICEIAQQLPSGATVSNLLYSIDTIFSNEAGGVVTLSTIHKAKGLEWPRVHFVNRHELPPRWAKLDWERQQSANACYVGVTRAQQSYFDLDFPK